MMVRCKMEFWLMGKADNEKSGADYSVQSMEACGYGEC